MKCCECGKQVVQVGKRFDDGAVACWPCCFGATNRADRRRMMRRSKPTKALRMLR